AQHDERGERNRQEERQLPWKTPGARAGFGIVAGGIFHEEAAGPGFASAARGFRGRGRDWKGSWAFLPTGATWDQAKPDADPRLVIASSLVGRNAHDPSQARLESIVGAVGVGGEVFHHEIDVLVPAS